MGRAPKIDKVELENLLQAGRSQAQISRLLSVSRCAVHKAIRRFGIQSKKGLLSNEKPESGAKAELKDFNYDREQIRRDIKERTQRAVEQALAEAQARRDEEANKFDVFNP
jgi:transposase